MTKNHRLLGLLNQVFRSANQEIERHRRSESHRLGQDIGWERAVAEWMQNYFPAWKRCQWQMSIAAIVRQDELQIARMNGLVTVLKDCPKNRVSIARLKLNPTPSTTVLIDSEESL